MTLSELHPGPKLTPEDKTRNSLRYTSVEYCRTSRTRQYRVLRYTSVEYCRTSRTRQNRVLTYGKQRFSKLLNYQWVVNTLKAVRIYTLTWNTAHFSVFLFRCFPSVCTLHTYIFTRQSTLTFCNGVHPRSCVFAPPLLFHGKHYIQAGYAQRKQGWL